MTAKILLLTFLSLLVCAVAALAQQPQIPAVPESPVAPGNEPTIINRFFAGGGNYLGIYTEEVTKENASRYGLREASGVGISGVAKNSPAERAGLKKGDVILKFDDEAVTNARKLTRLINEASPDHTARLTITRGGAEQTISATLGKREEQFARDFNIAPLMQDNVRRQIEELGRSPNFLNMNFRSARRIGVSTTPLTEQLAGYFKVKSGALVSTVSENSPAAKAGIKAGDVITEVNNQEIKRAEDITRILNSAGEGEVTLRISRDKHQRTIKLTPERGEQQLFNFSPTARNIRIPAINIPPMRLAPLNINPVRPIPPVRVNPVSPVM